jgi:hypothetical protein
MQFKDYDENNVPRITLGNTEECIYPIMKAFAPAETHDSIYKLNAIYKWVENLIEDARNQAVCQSGCYHCCAQKVVVKPIEIINITNNLGEFTPRDNGLFCPLLDLDNGKCGVYKFRPLTCRTMLTFDDPKYCVTNETHHIFDFPQANTAISSTLSNLGHLGQILATKIGEVFTGEDLVLHESIKPLVK